MSLVNCHECDREISTQAKVCPHCGAPLKKTNRLEWYYWAPIVIILIFIGLVFLGWLLPKPSNLEQINTASEPENQEVIVYSSEKDKLQTPSEPEQKTTEDIKNEIKGFCANKWEEDYRMQNYCIDTQTKSFVAISKIYTSNLEGSEAHKILGRCMNKWKKSNFYDYQMVEYCANNEIEAYNNIYGN